MAEARITEFFGETQIREEVLDFMGFGSFNSLMYGLRGNRARKKTALMPDPLRRSSFGCTTLDSRHGYGHGAPEEGPVGTLPQRAGLGKLGVA